MNSRVSFLKKTYIKSEDYRGFSRVQLPPAQNSFAAIPESSAEVLKARKVKALRAFLCQWFYGMM
ncbi:hypothetical protein PUG46_14385 [Erwiniaceae bacterium L1_55_4]|nr:hypothetical protein [Erwiniaceae bacterium L1_55_4]